MPKIIENIQNNILETGKNQLLSEGYDKVTVRSIAKECGIAVGTIYNYFPSKEMLVAHIMLGDWQQSMDELNGRICEAVSPVDGFRIIYNTVRHYSQTYRRIWQDFGRSTAVSEERHNMLLSQLKDPVKSLIDRFGCRKDPDPCSFIAETILYAGCRENSSFNEIDVFLERIL